MSALSKAAILGSIPSGFMLVSTCIGLGKAVPDKVAGALQHFAAGVLLCTVGTELLPAMVNATGWAENIAAAIGFFCGMGTLILLANLLPESPEDGDGDGSEDDETSTYELDGDLPAVRHVVDAVTGQGGDQESPNELQRLRFVIAGRRYRQRHSRSSSGSQEIFLKRSSHSKTPSTQTEERALLIKVSKNNKTPAEKGATPTRNNYRAGLCDVTEGEELESLRQHKNSDSLTKAFPLAFVIAIAIDSSLDGLLIGIASAAGPSAGPMMSASLSVEMSFLGLTLATALYGQSVPRAMLGSLLGPVCLALAAALGGAMAATLSQSPVLFVGMLSFGTSALLFMVAEELLLEAHEDGGSHVWWVDFQLYTGFFASIVAGKFVGKE